MILIRRLWSAARPHLKAVTSAAVAGATVYLTVRSDGVTSGEWGQVLGAAAVAGGATWLVPYLPQPEG